MNVILENLPNCLAKLRVEVDSEKVANTRSEITTTFCRNAKLPGYRPGKAPRKLIESRFSKHILEETSSQLIRDALTKAIQQKNLEVLSSSLEGEPRFESDGSFTFVAQVTLAPEFQLPDYSSIPCDATREEITEEKVDRFLEALLARHATFESAGHRPLALGDFAILSYHASLDNQPLADAAPDTPPQITNGRNTWLLIDNSSLLPGFCPAILGMEPAAEREFDLTVPNDSPYTTIAGKTIHYHVTLHDIQIRKLPPLDDALAETILPGSNASTIRDHCRQQLERSADLAFARAKRQSALNFLLSQVHCDLPENFVHHEMRGILREIVRENQERGVSDEEIRRHQDELLGAAERSARQRVLSNFLLLKIAQKENIPITEQDVTALLLEMSIRYDIPAKKLISSIQKRHAWDDIREQILIRKALDLLASRVTLSSPSAPSAS